MTAFRRRQFLGALVPLGIGGYTSANGGTTTPTHSSLVGPTGNTNPASLQRVTIAEPSAGHDWSYTVPPRTWLRLLTAATRLRTSSTVANRFAGLRILDPAGVKIGEIQETFAISAGLLQKITYSRSISWNQGGQAGDDVRTVAVTIPALIMSPGYRLQSATPNLQPGDRYSATYALCECWTTAPLLDVPGPMLT